MWVRFTAAYTCQPSPRIMIAFPKGYTGSVRRLCGEAAIAKGRAVLVATPRRGERPHGA